MYSSLATVFDKVDHEPLNCQEYREFWVSWNLGIIEVGSGLTVGKNKFLNYSDSSAYEVNDISIRTPLGVNGSWEINCESGVYAPVSLHIILFYFHSSQFDFMKCKYCL